MDKNLKNYFTTKMKGLDIPDDLLAIIQSQSKKKSIFNFKPPIPNPLEIANTKLLLPETNHPLLTHDYLNEKSRADDDIMSNVSAMNDTAEKFAFVASQNRGLLGYWLGSPKTSRAPYLYLLDTEGQYEICEGKSLAETLCYKTLIDGNTDKFNLLSNTFKKVGVHIEHKSKDQIFTGMDFRKKEIEISPKIFRHERYNFYRSEKGLPHVNF